MPTQERREPSNHHCRDKELSLRRSLLRKDEILLTHFTGCQSRRAWRALDLFQTAEWFGAGGRAFRWTLASGRFVELARTPGGGALHSVKCRRTGRARPRSPHHFPKPLALPHAG